ncbi:AraC family transcriptional regulator [Epilithonimonas arachidiradicis]|uniref:AraC family transcriptional regulator n=1 Tax=Epilithonimonas arachidiradicis TaxID=1617282 RepID=A0A420D8U4_9FLAO|nr:AraC family transcriptional regulator [Epilithonimonas arachidiradicis]RKE87182.1 AraC-like DNA-binding protein [Epilithonimonas arachidiradicis]GGG58970.1 AraC family transcriptional regulator [Epilithonimonas arachidiradicis]
MTSFAVLHTHLFQNDKKDSDFYFNTLEKHLKKNKKHIENPHRHDSYVTVLFTNGTGTHEIDFNTYDVSAGSLFFLLPGQVHSWKLSDDAKGFIFFTSPEYYDLHYINLKLKDYPFFGSPNISRKINIENQDMNKIVSLLQVIESENNHSDVMKDCLIIALLTVMYIYATRHYTEQETAKSDLRLSYFRHYYDYENLIEKNFKTIKSVSEFAAKLHITAKHLNRITQSVINKKASEILVDRVVLEAKRMLIFLDDSVVDIAFSLGYEDYSYFARLFKKHSGYSPVNFRQKYKV